MGLGIFTAVCVIAKTVYLNGVFAFDYTYAITRSATWAAVETFVGITTVSIPTLKPLFVKIREVASSRRSSGSNGSRGSGSSGKGSFQKLFYSPKMSSEKSPSSTSTHSYPRNNSVPETGSYDYSEKSDRQWFGASASGGNRGIRTTAEFRVSRDDPEAGLGIGYGDVRKPKPHIGVVGGVENES